MIAPYRADCSVARSLLFGEHADLRRLDATTLVFDCAVESRAPVPFVPANVVILKVSMPDGAVTAATHLKPPPDNAEHPYVEALRFIVRGAILTLGPAPCTSVTTMDCGIANPDPLAGTVTAKSTEPAKPGAEVICDAVEPPAADGMSEDDPPWHAAIEIVPTARTP